MNHVKDIECLIRTLMQNDRFHALVVESPAGWGKSSTLERVLNDLGRVYHSLGSYVTPLALYNALSRHPNDILLLDDCAGLFGDLTGMALLKAASWARAGSLGKRVITWNSTSEKVLRPSVTFSGKLILLANSIPEGRETQAFLSRTLYLKIHFAGEEAAQMLRDASKQIDYFSDQETVQKVTDFLAARAMESETESINLRTLQMAYELARANPENWKDLLEKLVPRTNPRAILASLAQSQLSVEEQSREFIRITGLSRRTYFKYRSELTDPKSSLM